MLFFSTRFLFAFRLKGISSSSFFSIAPPCVRIISLFSFNSFKSRLIVASEASRISGTGYEDVQVSGSRREHTNCIRSRVIGVIPYQIIILFRYEYYWWVRPAIELKDGFFLKTIYPGRKVKSGMGNQNNSLYDIEYFDES